MENLLNLSYENKDNIHKVKFYFKVLKIKQQSQSLLNDVIWPPTNLQTLVCSFLSQTCVYLWGAHQRKASIHELSLLWEGRLVSFSLRSRTLVLYPTRLPSWRPYFNNTHFLGYAVLPSKICHWFMTYLEPYASWIFHKQ